MSDQRNGGIVWTNQTWNPLRGFTRVSAGCVNCYAEAMAARFCGPGQPYEGTINPETKRWNGKIRLVPEKLTEPLPSLDWVVAGGESGHHARPMVLSWAKDIVRQCKSAGVPVLVKQIGANPTNREGEPHKISDRKGAIMEEWPEELRIREYPR